MTHVAQKVRRIIKATGNIEGSDILIDVEMVVRKSYQIWFKWKFLKVEYFQGSTYNLTH